MAAKAARLVPLQAHAGYVVVPRCKPLEVTPAGHHVCFAWDSLSAHWALPELCGVVISTQLRCKVWTQGCGLHPLAGAIRAWKPAALFLSEGVVLHLAELGPGLITLYPFVKDADYVRPPPLAEDAPLPGLLEQYRVRADLFD